VTHREPGVVLVSGAVSEIGRAAARRLAARGARVLLADEDHEAGQELAAERAGGGAHVAFEPLTADPADELDDFTQRAAAHFGEIDALIHAPVTAEPATFLEADARQLDRLYASHLRAPFALDRALAQRMSRAGGGAIVHVVPACALEPARGLSSVAAIGGAIVALTRSLAHELRGQRIRVNLVVARTPSDDRARKVTPERAGTGPSPAPVSPDDVAEAIAYLLDERSAALVGGVVHVTGGEPMAR
jgi:NAD(P)-dependent dehydrogenase (short-subunit alcohol dehydrogenase family)